MGDGGFDRQTLLHLAEINEVFKTVREAEVAEHRLCNARIAASVLLVAFHHGGRDVEIFRVGKAADHIHRRIGLEAKLRTKPRGDIAVMVEVTAFVPD